MRRTRACAQRKDLIQYRIERGVMIELHDSQTSTRPMIRREQLRIVMTCDGCGTVREDQKGLRAKWRPHGDVWKEAQAEGWTSKQKPDGKDWDHFCPGCR